jgi:acetylornithine deacetylase/succinyl-diaminopimelate desuccinylase-like protein
MLEAVATQVLADNPPHSEADIDVVVPVIDRRTYTGLDRPIPGANPAYILPSDHPAVAAAENICRDVLKEDRPTGVWQFATDGGHFAEAGMAPIGFGPGDEFLAHTVNEHIEIAALEEAMEVNEALARRLAAEAS